MARGDVCFIPLEEETSGRPCYFPTGPCLAHLTCKTPLLEQWSDA